MAQAQLTQAGAPKLPKVYLDCSPRLSPMSDTVKLLSGFEMPLIGFGTWQILQKQTIPCIKHALDSGYRLIDCARSFKNHTLVADGVVQWMDDRKVERSEIFISSKIWNTFHSRARCLEEVDRILREFQTPYIDLITIHWPMSWEENGDEFFPKNRDNLPARSNIDYLETWRALESAQKRGKIRSIGFCNFNLEQAERIWNEAEIKPSVAMVELHPFNTQVEYRRFCKERGIVLVAHAPLANPGSNLYRKMTDPDLLRNETIISIARNHGKSTVQVLLRWIVDSGLCAIVKSSDQKRIRQNINIFKFKLTPEEIERIDYLNIDKRIINPQVGNVNDPNFPWPFVGRS